MSLLKGKTEGGSGDERGYSNMAHRAHTEEIKAAIHRRQNRIRLNGT
jgi:hypothetical protein